MIRFSIVSHTEVHLSIVSHTRMIRFSIVSHTEVHQND